MNLEEAKRIGAELREKRDAAPREQTVYVLQTTRDYAYEDRCDASKALYDAARTSQAPEAIEWLVGELERAAEILMGRESNMTRVAP